MVSHCPNKYSTPKTMALFSFLKQFSLQIIKQNMYFLLVNKWQTSFFLFIYTVERHNSNSCADAFLCKLHDHLGVQRVDECCAGQLKIIFMDEQPMYHEAGSYHTWIAAWRGALEWTCSIVRTTVTLLIFRHSCRQNAHRIIPKFGRWTHNKAFQIWLTFDYTLLNFSCL